MKNKLRIMKAMPPVTDDEIRSHMDFDALVRQHSLHVENRTNWLRGFRIMMAVSVVTGAVYLLLNRDNSGDNLIDPEKTSPVETTEKISGDEKSPVENHDNPPAPAKRNKANAITSQPELVQPTQTYTRAEPRSGYKHLYEYFSRQLKYPKEAIKDSVQGTVVISFLIDEHGHPAKTIVENSLGPLFDEECLRLIASMPDWNPALLNGTPTSASVSLPLTFRIRNRKSELNPAKPETASREQTYMRAEPKSGYHHLYTYFSNELKYPKEAVKDSVQGTAVVSFTIDEHGKVAKVTIENSLGLLFDQECFRLIAQMPAWDPAQLNGAPISARISLPLTFKIIKQIRSEK